jgi:hypothetical protein
MWTLILCFKTPGTLSRATLNHPTGFQPMVKGLKKVKWHESLSRNYAFLTLVSVNSWWLHGSPLGLIWTREVRAGWTQVRSHNNKYLHSVPWELKFTSRSLGPNLKKACVGQGLRSPATEIHSEWLKQNKNRLKAHWVAPQKCVGLLLLNCYYLWPALHHWNCSLGREAALLLPGTPPLRMCDCSGQAILTHCCGGRG